MALESRVSSNPRFFGFFIEDRVLSIVLMHVLGNNMLVGLPQNVRILHIAQLEAFSPGRTILQEVLDSDTERTRIIKEAQGESFRFSFCNTTSSIFFKPYKIFIPRQHLKRA